VSKCSYQKIVSQLQNFGWAKIANFCAIAFIAVTVDFNNSKHVKHSAWSESGELASCRGRRRRGVGAVCQGKHGLERLLGDVRHGGVNSRH